MAYAKGVLLILRLDTMAGTYRLLKAHKKSMAIKAGMVAALMMLVFLSGIALIRIQQFAESFKAVEDAHLVIEAIHQVLLDVKDAESAQRGYLITGHSSFLLSHDGVAQRLKGKINTLRELIADSPRQMEQMPSFEEMIRQRMNALRLGIELFEASALEQSRIVDLVQGHGMSSMAQLHVQAHHMLSIEEAMLKKRALVVSQNASSTRQWIFFGNLFALGLLLYGVWAILREIDQRKAAQREIQRYTAQLELTNKELESFSYSVSHDLRSPLRAIDGYSRILQEDFAERLDDEGRRVLNVVRDSSKKMGMLIDDLLTFSRLGRKPLDLRAVDMNELVAEVWKDAVTQVENPPDLELDILPSCMGDRSLLRQVVLNLLSNAIKYSSTIEAPRIHIYSMTEEDEVVYCISDNGVGFDMRFYDKLFGVFQRLHSEHEFPGTGVGLAIVKRVIVRHGGRAWATSDPGRETVFHFSLPLEGSGT